MPKSSGTHHSFQKLSIGWFGRLSRCLSCPRDPAFRRWLPCFRKIQHTASDVRGPFFLRIGLRLSQSANLRLFRTGVQSEEFSRELEASKTPEPLNRANHALSCGQSSFEPCRPAFAAFFFQATLECPGSESLAWDSSGDFEACWTCLCLDSDTLPASCFFLKKENREAKIGCCWFKLGRQALLQLARSVTENA